MDISCNISKLFGIRSRGNLGSHLILLISTMVIFYYLASRWTVFTTWETCRINADGEMRFL